MILNAGGFLFYVKFGQQTHIYCPLERVLQREISAADSTPPLAGIGTASETITVKLAWSYQMLRVKLGTIKIRNKIDK